MIDTLVSFFSRLPIILTLISLIPESCRLTVIFPACIYQVSGSQSIIQSHYRQMTAGSQQSKQEDFDLVSGIDY